MMNYYEKRVRFIPNILRRNRGRFEKTEVKLGVATNATENRSRNRFDVASDAKSAEANDNRLAEKPKTMGRNWRRRKQDLSFKVLRGTDLEWTDCASKSLCEKGEVGLDLDIATSSFQEPTTDHQVASESQLSIGQSLLEFCFNEVTEWLDVQSSMQVESKEATDLIPDIPLVNEIEALLAAEETIRSGKKKLKSLSDLLERENRNPQTGDESVVDGLPYCCWICNKRYAFKSSLRYHTKKVHSFDNQRIKPAETSTKGLRSKKFRNVGPCEEHRKKLR